MSFFSTISNHVYIIGPLFIMAGVLHFIFPEKYAQIMPDYIPKHQAMVFWSGVFEVLGGIGILIPQLKILAGWGLIALLIAVFPANIEMFWKAWVKKGFSLYSMGLLLRLPLQFLMIYWVYMASGLSFK